jgi:hypothetical protein
MPVAYTATNKGFRWQASGPEKYFIRYFVEYPIGSEDPEAERKDAKKKQSEAAAPKSKETLPSVSTPAARTDPSAATIETKPTRE